MELFYTCQKGKEDKTLKDDIPEQGSNFGVFSVFMFADAQLFLFYRRRTNLRLATCPPEENHF